MKFNSPEFAVFLPIVYLLYWFCTAENLRLKNLLLLLSSYFFYGWWDARFLLLLFLSTFIDFRLGQSISRAGNLKVKKIQLIISLILNLGILGFFKYFNFFISSFDDMLMSLGYASHAQILEIALPVGISFYTFHGISYVIDIYRGRIEAENDYVNYALFVGFFPLLVAGPIERAANLIPQIKKQRTFIPEQFQEALVLLVSGLFRKMVIADSLAKYVDLVYANPSYYSASTLLLATIFYAFQIYFDFSGYSDIASGTARLFGFKLLPNFRFPYFASSVTAFWRRWHISLSSWLRDYLYIEIGGNRKGRLLTFRNILITMLLGGLWHGGHWTFVVWGGIHAGYLIAEKLSAPLKDTFPRLKWETAGYMYTFTAVCLSWVYFRSASIEEANLIIGRIFSGDLNMPLIGDINHMISSLFVLLIGICFDFYLSRRDYEPELFGSQMTPVSRLSFICLGSLMIVLFYAPGSNFIYFRF